MTERLPILVSGRITVLLSTYKNFAKDSTDLYSKADTQITNASVDVYEVVMHAAVYASGIAVIICGLILLFYHNHSTQSAESKKRLITVFIIIVCIFSASGIVNMISNAVP